MNKVILMGRLTADPELRVTPQTNTSVARFSLAVNRSFKAQEGQPTADFFNIVAWKEKADFVGKYFKKGQQVLIEGYLRNNNWTDKDGNKRFNVEVYVDQAYFADSKRDGQGGDSYAPKQGGYQAPSSAGSSAYGNAPQGGSQANTPETGDGFYTLSNDDEDLPF
jgi:single-strand DNA-binding protein